MYGDVHQCDPNIHKQKLTGWCSGVSMLYRHQLYHPQLWRYRHNGWNELSDTRQTTVIIIQYADIVQFIQNKMQARDRFKFIIRKELCSLLNTLVWLLSVEQQQKRYPFMWSYVGMWYWIVSHVHLHPYISPLVAASFCLFVYFGAVLLSNITYGVACHISNRPISVVFLFCFSSSCALYVASFSGLSIFDYLFCII